MGLLDWLGLTDSVAMATQSANRGVVTPWAGPTTLSKVVVDDIFGIETTTVTRRMAMAVPAVANARNIICTTLARQPIKAYKGAAPVENQPTFLYRTDTGVTPFHRMLWTLDDLFFYGWSLWAVQRGADDQILDAMRVPADRWKFDQAWNVLVDDKEADPDEIILIPGLGEGLLTEAYRTVRGSIDLETQWQARVKNPVPVVELRYTGEDDLTVAEMEEVRDTYVRARNDDNGVVMVTPKGFEVHAHGDNALDLFTEGRNAASLDVARYANLPATTIDATSVNASSVTYQNVMAGRSELLDITLRSWAAPIEARLSQDDVVPRGTYVQFDLSSLTIPDSGTGPVRED